MTAPHPITDGYPVLAALPALRDIEIAARAWIEVAGDRPRPVPVDEFERGYNAALNACGERVLQLLVELRVLYLTEEEREAESSREIDAAYATYPNGCVQCGRRDVAVDKHGRCGGCST